MAYTGTQISNPPQDDPFLLYFFFFCRIHFDVICLPFSAKRAAIIRASDDFWPRDPASHTIHIASIAYNTLFLGEFMQPDWDMFHVSSCSVVLFSPCTFFSYPIICLIELEAPFYWTYLV